MSMKRLSMTILLSLLLVITSYSQSSDAGYAEVTQYTVEVINVYPHDPTAFTQGLLIENGVFFESTGLRNQSTLREVDITTGEVIRSVDVTRTAQELETMTNYFAEGLEWVNDSLIQLTWQANVAFVYDPITFEQTGTFEYDGEGWGICYDDRYIFVSDSTEYIAIRDPETFDLIGRMLVTLQGSPIQARLLNELECVGDYIYANLWQTDFIVQIDKYNGNVVGIIDAANLMTPEMISEIPGSTQDDAGNVLPPSGAVLNGIAYNPETDTFFITGKLWSRVFEVRFVSTSGDTIGG